MDNKKKIIIISAIILLLSSSLILKSVKADEEITQIQYKFGDNNGSAQDISLSLDSAPTDGNILICCIGEMRYPASGLYVDSITQDGVYWEMVIRSDAIGGSAPYYARSEIWVGYVGEEANTDILVDIYPTPSGYWCFADVFEYSNLDMDNLIDETAHNENLGGAGIDHSDTGTTDTTDTDNELWIGAVYSYSGGSTLYDQYDPTNDFTLYDGISKSNGGIQSLACLEKIVSETGEANSGTTIDYSEWMSSCIATFRGVSTAPTPTPTPTTYTEEDLGDYFVFGGLLSFILSFMVILIVLQRRKN